MRTLGADKYNCLDRKPPFDSYTLAVKADVARVQGIIESFGVEVNNWRTM